MLNKDNFPDESRNGLLAFLGARQSSIPQEITSPAPSDAVVLACLKAAMAAPDHGAVRPWRYYGLRDVALGRLAELAVKSALIHNPQTEPAKLDEIRMKLTRSPMMVIAAAKFSDHLKADDQEQLIAASMSCYGFLLALSAQGVAYKLITGALARDSALYNWLGLDSNRDAIIGLIQMGAYAEPTGERKPIKSKIRPEAKAHWQLLS